MVRAPARSFHPPGVGRVQGDDLRTSKSLDFKSSPIRFSECQRGQHNGGFVWQLVWVLPPSLAACQIQDRQSQTFRDPRKRRTEREE